MDEIHHPRETRIPGRAPLRPVPLWRRAIALMLKAVLPLAILAGAGWYARDVMQGAPVAGRLDPERVARLVAVEPAAAAGSDPIVEAWGAVEAARRLVVRPEIGGRVIWVNPGLTPGGHLDAGKGLLRIDDRALALQIAQAEARRDEIDARILIERGQQQRARRDLERSPLTGLSAQERALILREPQMRELEAQRAAAETEVERLRVERSKTRIALPFDAVVISEEVETGTMLSPGAQAAELIGTDRFRVVLAVPPAALDRIDPDGGQRVRLTQPGVWPEGMARTGRLVGTTPALTGTGRMAELIVEVEDPLALRPDTAGQPALRVGSYLRAELQGRPVAGAVHLDRAHLHEGDRVWVMGEDGRLDIREVSVAWRGAEAVLIAEGLDPGERVVTTRLATPAEGMALRLAAEGGE